MSLVSESPKQTGGVPCICCGKAPSQGGYYCGPVELVICADCLRFDDLNSLGILLGDALLDMYRRGLPRDNVTPLIATQEIIQRLELQIYRAISIGLYRERKECKP